jgi:hypothetical protein
MRRLMVLAVAAAWLVSAVAPVAAVAAPMPAAQLVISAGSRVAVMADGVALAVPVTYNCPARYAPLASWSVEVIEVLPNGSVRDGMDPSGPGSYLTCDGQTRTSEVLVLPPLPYRAGGSATLVANALACTPDGSDCVQPAIKKTVNLRAATPSDPANQPAPVTARLLSPSEVSITVPRGCPSGRLSRTSALLEQRIPGDDITEGGGSSTPATCNGTSTTIAVTTGSASLLFHRGSSYIYGYTSVCVRRNCTDQQVFRGLLDIR